MRPVLRVLGVGSPHGDDQLGWRLVEALGCAPEPGLEAVAVGDPIDLLDRLGGEGTLVVVDACRCGLPPGTVLRRDWPADDIEAPGSRSSHGLGVAPALALAEALGRLPRSVVLLGVEAGPCGSGGGLSPEAERALPQVRSLLQALVRERAGPDRVVPDRRGPVGAV